MGVPAFFRWLSDKFPKVATQAVEEQPTTVGGSVIPVDTTKPNPNGEEFHNLYLDMNGIIHPCCHPEDKPAPATEDEMIVEIFAYLDRVVDIVRPRRLLYMAIDGVAPRAKMNQQRARRFRSAQLAQIEREAAEKVETELTAIGQGHQLPPKKEHFDSNCITPGTPFMAHLAFCLRYHIADKQNNDPLWKDLKVVLSDATVPGEGEHKMMDYIRVQRAFPDHDPNTSHVIYGLDADLIMLALSTHEPHFKIIREDVFVQQGSKKNCTVCNKPGHHAAQCSAKNVGNAAAPASAGTGDKPAEKKPYVFLHVNVLREYLEHALKFNVPGIPFDLERAIDDWVFMCFFVGNDFLPHLPSLEIREGAISTLSLLWKECMPMMGGYITYNGEVDLKRAQVLVTELGRKEDEIFKDRKDKEERRSRNAKRRKIEHDRRKQDESQVNQGFNFAEMTAAPVWDVNANMSNSQIVEHRAELRQANHDAAAALKAELLGQSAPQESRGVKRKETELSDNEESKDSEDKEEKNEDDDDEDGPSNAEETDLEAAGKAILEKVAADKKAKDDAAREREPDDAVRLWESGWKERYYETKFKIPLSDREAISHIVKSYCEGLCWVFKYYYRGCPSWSWYYPYHYAPMASDFDNIAKYEIKFEMSQPLKPFEQLMGVLPLASRAHIPKPFHTLMADESSAIIDYYPLDFEVDMDGKKWEWQGVVKLPFIDPKKLVEEMNKYYDQLTEEEQIRNARGPSYLFVSDKQDQLYNQIATVYAKRTTTESLKIDTRYSHGMSGHVDMDPECIPRSTLRSPLPEHGLEDIANDKSISVIYILPVLAPDHPYPTKLLPHINLPSSVLAYDDLRLATFEKIDQRRNQDNRRGYVPHIQHMEEYRDHGSRDRPSQRQYGHPRHSDRSHFPEQFGYGGRPHQPPHQQWGYNNYGGGHDYSAYERGPPQGYNGYGGHGHSYGRGGSRGGPRGGGPRGGGRGGNRGSRGGRYPQQGYGGPRRGPY